MNHSRSFVIYSKKDQKGCVRNKEWFVTKSIVLVLCLTVYCRAVPKITKVERNKKAKNPIISEELQKLTKLEAVVNFIGSKRYCHC